MADPVQKGNELVAKPAPSFTNFVVVDGTWKEKDALVVVETLDGNSETHNYTGSNPGVDATCDVVIKKTDPATAPLKKMDVITTTETVPRKFLVLDVENSDFGGRPLKQTLTLAHRTSVASAL